MGDATRGKRLVVGVSGASGISLAVRFLQTAATAPEIERLHLVVTNNALRVAAGELGQAAASPAGIIAAARLPAPEAAKIEIHPDADIGATVASGSYPTDGMVIIPCSSGTLGAIANGISRGLVQRAADLTLKERRRLILVLRETPLSEIHAENILRVTRAGAIVMPPVPPFYIGERPDDWENHFCMRVLDLFGVELDRAALRWRGAE